jgi:hypothetical protein
MPQGQSTGHGRLARILDWHMFLFFAGVQMQPFPCCYGRFSNAREHFQPLCIMALAAFNIQKKALLK